MKHTTKLKPTNWRRSLIIGIVASVLFFSFFAFIRTVMATRTADILSGVLYLGVTTVCLISWIRSKLVLIIPVVLMNLVLALHFFFEMQILAIIINTFNNLNQPFVYIKASTVYIKITSRIRSAGKLV